MFSSRVAMYVVSSIFPSTLTSFHAEENPPEMPPPCLTVGMVGLLARAELNVILNGG